MNAYLLNYCVTNQINQGFQKEGINQGKMTLTDISIDLRCYKYSDRCC